MRCSIWRGRRLMCWGIAWRAQWWRGGRGGSCKEGLGEVSPAARAQSRAYSQFPRLLGLRVVIGVLAIELRRAGAVGYDSQYIVFAQRLHGALHIVEGGGADLHHQHR